jgi:hypothetical protein
MKLALAAALVASTTSPATAECPQCVWSDDATCLATYRPSPIVDNGKITYRGFLPEYAEECESQQSQSMSNQPWDPENLTPTFTVKWGYDYAWNAAVGVRSFWEDEEQGNNKSVKWYQSCSEGYEKKSWWGWSTSCVIPSTSKFLGEPCSTKSDCQDFTAKYLDTTCAPTNNDLADPQYKCLLDEEANVVSPYADTCSCLGVIWCASEDCGGSQCVLSSMDMAKHCKVSFFFEESRQRMNYFELTHPN